MKKSTGQTGSRGVANIFIAISSALCMLIGLILATQAHAQVKCQYPQDNPTVAHARDYFYAADHDCALQELESFLNVTTRPAVQRAEAWRLVSVARFHSLLGNDSLTVKTAVIEAGMEAFRADPQWQGAYDDPDSRYVSWMQEARQKALQEKKKPAGIVEKQSSEATKPPAEATEVTPDPWESLSKEETNSIGMELALVRPGSFIMGSPKGNEDEVPVRRVTITKPFYIGKYEVSCAEFAAIWSYVGVDLKPPDNQENPVSGVTWNLAQSYCSYLSAKEGAVYRLPTEAEWEYAARGGHLSKSSLYSGGDDAGAVAVCRGSVLQSRGSKDANELGIYDMSGNVWEWCYDWYAAYPFSSETDPAGPVKGIQRVRRGGSYIDSPASCRLTCRDHAPPGDQSFTSGFRVLREVSIPEVKEQIGASLPAHAQWFEGLSGWTAPVGKGQSDMVQDNIATVDQSEDLPEEDEFVLLDSAPEMISEVPLQYPAAARDARIEGTVWVKVLVDSKGNVRKAKIAKSSGFQSLDDIAVKLAVGNKFKPATQYGEPVAAWTTYKVDFRLSNQSK